MRSTSRGSSREPRDPTQGSVLMNSPLAQRRYPPVIVNPDPIERAFMERMDAGSITYKVENAETASFEPIVF